MPGRGPSHVMGIRGREWGSSVGMVTDGRGDESVVMEESGDRACVI
jgi:hypothetical protein